MNVTGRHHNATAQHHTPAAADAAGRNSDLGGCPALAQGAESVAGVVVMYGKDGSLLRLVKELAAALRLHGYEVTNLEVPWSGQRE